MTTRVLGALYPKQLLIWFFVGDDSQYLQQAESAVALAKIFRAHATYSLSVVFFLSYSGHSMRGVMR